jgi:Asp-tRNA(Asn)/Glu-tRNA(Gln) amidotransferase A subunit family amidase
MGVEGPMVRRVADLRAAFEVMAGPTWRDPWTVPVPLRGPKPATPVRVALLAAAQLTAPGTRRSPQTKRSFAPG